MERDPEPLIDRDKNQPLENKKTKEMDIYYNFRTIMHQGLRTAIAAATQAAERENPVKRIGPQQKLLFPCCEAVTSKIAAAAW